MWINIYSVNSDFVMKMRTRRPARRADKADYVSGFYFLTCGNIEFG